MRVKDIIASRHPILIRLALERVQNQTRIYVALFMDAVCAAALGFYGLVLDSEGGPFRAGPFAGVGAIALVAFIFAGVTMVQNRRLDAEIKQLVDEIGFEL